MVMPVTRRWTAADVRALTREDRAWPRYELIDGELLVTPAPRGPHQFVILELAVLLHAYLKRVPIGFTMLSPADLELAPDTVTQPDLFVVPLGIEIAATIPEWSDIKSLLLAVEVLSPGSSRTDRVVKRDFYLMNGVSDYWIVDYDARVVERWKPTQETPELCRERIEWAPRDHEPLSVDLLALFGHIEETWNRLVR